MHTCACGCMFILYTEGTCDTCSLSVSPLSPEEDMVQLTSVWWPFPSQSKVNNQ